MLHTFLSIFPFTVCLFWTAVYILEWRENNPARRMLTMFMGICTILYLCHALFFNGLSNETVDIIYDFCNIAVFPLYLLYIFRLTDSRPLSWRYAVVLAPALLVCILSALTHVEKFVVKGIFILQLLPICWIGLRRLRDFDRKIENFFSDTEKRSVVQTRNMMVALLVCSFFSAVASIVGRDMFMDNPSFLFIPSLLFGSLLFVVGFVGQKQVFCADDLDCAIDAEVPELPSTPTTPKMLQYLSDMMESEHLYLNPDLRLSDVAAMLNVSRTTLSATINQNADLSFSDYVNGYRVRHAQDILRNNPKATSLSVIQIAQMSGFSSESSFYRAFRKYVGMTPKEWLTRTI